jgi:CRISPR-associated endoribonuclease Cas6
MDAKSLEDFSSQATGAILTMGGASFRVLGASAIDENEMSQCLDMKKQDLTQPFHGVSIDFLLPTGFKSNNRQVIFPTPELFFGSLAIRWLKLTQNGEPYDPVAFGMVMVENYSLSSAAVRLKNNQVFRGCVGNVRYSFNALPDESRSFLSRLASLAPFCGVGYKVSQGMGLVKIRFLAG